MYTSLAIWLYLIIVYRWAAVLEERRLWCDGQGASVCECVCVTDRGLWCEGQGASVCEWVCVCVCVTDRGLRSRRRMAEGSVREWGEVRRAVGGWGHYHAMNTAEHGNLPRTHRPTPGSAANPHWPLTSDRLKWSLTPHTPHHLPALAVCVCVCVSVCVCVCACVRVSVCVIYFNLLKSWLSMRVL